MRWRDGILVQTAEHLRVHLRDPVRRAEEAVAIGVFADREQDLAHGSLDAFDVDARVRRDVLLVDDRSFAHVNRCSIAPVYSAMYGRLR